MIWLVVQEAAGLQAAGGARHLHLPVPGRAQLPLAGGLPHLEVPLVLVQAQGAAPLVALILLVRCWL